MRRITVNGSTAYLNDYEIKNSTSTTEELYRPKEINEVNRGGLDG